MKAAPEQKIINRLTNIGITGNIRRSWGVYVITLDQSGYSKDEMMSILRIMSSNMILAYYDSLTNVLCINTRISTNQ